MITILTEFGPAIYGISTVVQNRSAGGGRDIGDRQTDGECNVASDGLEPGTELREVSPGAVAGGVVGLGGQRHPVALVVEDIRPGWAVGVWRG